MYNSDEDSDEEPPTEKEDLQKRIKELKKVIAFDISLSPFITSFSSIETRICAWAYWHADSADAKVPSRSGQVHSSILEPPRDGRSPHRGTGNVEF